MCPTSVSMPVEVTTNVAEPRVALVFMKTMSTRSPSVVSGSESAAMSLGTGSDSPVKGASSTSRVAAVMSRPSAGMRSPASIETMSPGTSSSAATSVI